ncbi:MAG: N(4)-(beta-N-acetylglucosaminyl)-L-asparaginase [Candidatus Hermodarchaeia archaeon]
MVSAKDIKSVIMGTRNAKEMLNIGAKILAEKGSALDAVEATIRAVEENPIDLSVGVGGIPNLLGIPQLDASLMEGKTRKAGAVASVEDFLHPISIARKVLEESPHTLLVGRGAELFAEAMGFTRSNLLTNRSLTLYRAFIEDALGDLNESFKENKQHYADSVKSFKLHDWYNKLKDNQHGTVNVIALDHYGNICSGVSTSGTCLKLPGRVGDSAVIGAGNYCDNGIGAAACTGRGELAIRLSTARMIVTYMEEGQNVQNACVKAMKNVHMLRDIGSMNCIAMDNRGNTASASTRRESIHYFMGIHSKIPEKRHGVWVKT